MSYQVIRQISENITSDHHHLTANIRLQIASISNSDEEQKKFNVSKLSEVWCKLIKKNRLKIGQEGRKER